jgi:hypothetical protein
VYIQSFFDDGYKIRCHLFRVLTGSLVSNSLRNILKN